LFQFHNTDLKQAVSIVITDYDFIPESVRCHTVFQMLEKEEHFLFNDLMEIHVLNLERLPADEEFKMVSEKNPMIHEAYCKLQVMSEDEANRMIYEARLKAQRDDYSRMNGALRKGREQGREQGLEEGREQGLEEGREQGRKEGREEIARNALAKGLSPDVIREITGLDIEAIRNIGQ
jgi:hypothetical protein